MNPMVTSQLVEIKKLAEKICKLDSIGPYAGSSIRRFSCDGLKAYQTRILESAERCNGQDVIPEFIQLFKDVSRTIWETETKKPNWRNKNIFQSPHKLESKSNYSFIGFDWITCKQVNLSDIIRDMKHHIKWAKRI